MEDVCTIILVWMLLHRATFVIPLIFVFEFYAFESVVDHLVNNAGIAHNFIFEDASDSKGMTQIWVSIYALLRVSSDTLALPNCTVAEFLHYLC